MMLNSSSSYPPPSNQQNHFVVILFISLFSLMACEVEKTPANSSRIIQIRDVEISKVEQQVLPVILSVPGTVVSKKQLKVASRLTGFIEKIHVDEGDIVKPDDVLVDIDNAQIEALIKGADASVLAAKAELLDADEDVKRIKKLVQSKIAAEDDLRNANVRRTGAKAKLATVQAELISKRKERRYAHITIPVHARVRERFFDPGDLTTAGQVILLLDVHDGLELEVYLPSTVIGSIAIGQTVKVEMDLFAEPLESKVSNIVRSLDDITRSYKVRLLLPDEMNFTPGQFGQAYIVLRQQAATVIADSTITQRAGIEGVFVMDESSTLGFRSVRLGKSWGKLREILSGLKPGERVVNNPTSLLRDGDKAR